MSSDARALVKRIGPVLGAVLLALAACSSGGGGGGGAPGGTVVVPTPTPTVAPSPTPRPTPVATPMPAAAWAGFVAASVEQYLRLDPAFAVSVGRHEFDGRLPDWSEAGIARLIDFWNGTIAQANAFTGLDATQRFERDYLVQVGRGQVFWLEDADMPHRNPAFYINGGLDLDVYLTREYSDPATRMRAVVSFLQAVPGVAATIRANLRMPLPATFIGYGNSSFGGLATYYGSDVPAAFAGVGDAALQQQLTTAAAAASQAMRDLAAWFNANAASATQDYALGPERFLRMLRAVEGIETTLAELESVGTADLQRNQSALAAACGRFAPGASVPTCVARMDANVPGDGSVAAATRQIAELRGFVTANDLVSIPSGDPLLVRESPPYNRGNGAYFAPIGPYETGVASIYYISPTAFFGDANLLFVSVHEAMPGHFLQFLHSNRAPSPVGRLFVGGFFAEGWAHYAEEMMWEAGLRGTPEAEVGMLANALLRNCRFQAAIGLHARGMSTAQAQTLFQQQCNLSAGTASQQTIRGTFDPSYLNYTLGKLMIRRLRADWTATRGGRAAWKAFHDQFLGYGGPPIPLVRQAMMGEATPRAVF